MFKKNFILYRPETCELKFASYPSQNKEQNTNRFNPGITIVHYKSTH